MKLAGNFSECMKTILLILGLACGGYAASEDPEQKILEAKQRISSLWEKVQELEKLINQAENSNKALNRWVHHLTRYSMEEWLTRRDELLRDEITENAIVPKFDETNWDECEQVLPSILREEIPQGNAYHDILSRIDIAIQAYSQNVEQDRKSTTQKNEVRKNILQENTDVSVLTHRLRRCQDSQVRKTPGFQMAHEKGFVGQGVKISVDESLFDYEGWGRYPNVSWFTFNPREASDSSLEMSRRHGNYVLSCLIEGAPGANIWNGVTDHLTPQAHFFSSSATVEKARETPKIKNFLKENPQSIIVIAAQNRNKPYLPMDLTQKVSLLDNVIHDLEWCLVVGSLNQRGEKSHFSNYPGPNTDVQERFLCALGEDSYRGFNGCGDTEGKRVGTSFAAPLGAAAAASVLSAFPTLTPRDVAWCLLNSTDKTFYVEDSKSWGSCLSTVFRGLLWREDRHPGKIILHDPNNDIVKSSRILYEQFDPAKYGQGVLNVGNALLLAEILNELGDKERALSRYKNALHFKTQKAARIIQRSWRAFSKRKPEDLFTPWDPIPFRLG